MEYSQGMAHLIPDLKEKNEDRRSNIHHSNYAKQPFQTTITSSWSYDGIRNKVTHTECIDKSMESPVMTQMIFQNYSVILTRVGSEILKMKELRLRQRLTLILEQKQMKMSNPLLQDQANSSITCNEQQDTTIKCHTYSNSLNDEHNHDFQNNTQASTTKSKSSCFFADSLSIDTDTNLEVSQSSVPKKASFLLQSNIHKRKVVKEEDEREFAVKINKKSRLSQTDRLQIQESMKGLLSSNNCDKNEDIGKLGFIDNNLEKEKKSMQYEVTRLNYLAKLLCHIGYLHQAFLLEMMSCLEEDSWMSDDIF